MLSPKSNQPKPGGQFHADLIGEEWPEVGIVSEVPGRKWFSVALLLMLTAIAAELVSKSYTGAGVGKVAESAEAINSAKRYARLGMDALAQVETARSAELRRMAHQSFERAGPLTVAGLGLFLFSVGCWGVSSYRREGGSSLVLAALVLGYVLLLSLMV